MEILTDKEQDREDSFWYEGDIAKEGHHLLVANGEIKVTFPDGNTYRDGQAPYEARLLGWTDHNIAKLYQEDKFQNNNWFEVIDLEDDGAMFDVAGDYDEAIQLLNNIASQCPKCGSGIPEGTTHRCGITPRVVR